MNVAALHQRISAARAELSAGRYIEAAQALDALLAELLDERQRRAVREYVTAPKRAQRRALRSALKAVR